MSLFNKGKKKFECDTNPETGTLECQSFRENPDGTRENLAEIKVNVDGLCRPSVTHASESEEGELTKLEEKVKGKIISKCQKNTSSQKPEGY